MEQQDAEKVRQHRFWFVWVIWLNQTNRINQINQMNQTNQSFVSTTGRRWCRPAGGLVPIVWCAHRLLRSTVARVTVR